MLAAGDRDCGRRTASDGAFVPTELLAGECGFFFEDLLAGGFVFSVPLPGVKYNEANESELSLNGEDTGIEGNDEADPNRRTEPEGNPKLDESCSDEADDDEDGGVVLEKKSHQRSLRWLGFDSDVGRRVDSRAGNTGGMNNGDGIVWLEIFNPIGNRIPLRVSGFDLMMEESLRMITERMALELFPHVDSTGVPNTTSTVRVSESAGFSNTVSSVKVSEAENGLVSPDVDGSSQCHAGVASQGTITMDQGHLSRVDEVENPGSSRVPSLVGEIGRLNDPMMVEVAVCRLENMVREPSIFAPAVAGDANAFVRVTAMHVTENRRDQTVANDGLPRAGIRNGGRKRQRFAWREKRKAVDDGVNANDGTAIRVQSCKKEGNHLLLQDQNCKLLKNKDGEAEIIGGRASKDVAGSEGPSNQVNLGTEVPNASVKEAANHMPAIHVKQTNVLHAEGASNDDSVLHHTHSKEAQPSPFNEREDNTVVDPITTIPGSGSGTVLRTDVGSVEVSFSELERVDAMLAGEAINETFSQVRSKRGKSNRSKEADATLNERPATESRRGRGRPGNDQAAKGVCHSLLKAIPKLVSDETSKDLDAMPI
ncbi:hypothetical protein NE237_010944 [Protea cynaroides]|uniref:Uncharacterized protein n=1 Tax=Protea cynaroides TaxID=273540 RepID=A0A9Q0L0N5_9MAGN|nr:hypothetical protein NE237_010944 [Protea cynaroides]